jgi:hypothetical protein
VTDYDFAGLNDKEFEQLCADLVGREHGSRFERFRPGKDGGIDGRYFDSDSGQVVLQCKHWPRSSLAKLLHHCAATERPKVDRLKPSRYIVALSHELSANDKKAFFEAFSPHVRSPNDIWGRSDLNDVLASNPDLELKHQKLWLNSTAVMTRLLNKGIHERSRHLIEEALQAVPRYVETKFHQGAVERLEKQRSLIVTGEPGIGKTTLATQLCLHYAEKGFDVVQLVESVSEAESVYSNSPQLFYFDDFLGETLLQGITGHEGSHITQFIRRIGGDPSKRFILTSRSTLLNQAYQLVNPFATSNLKDRELVLQVSELEPLDKAKILYSHIWHSELGDEFRDELYKDRRYREVIEHKNFNPRLIGFITDASRLTDQTPEQYWDFVKKSLSDPWQVWEHPFSVQQDEYSQQIILLVALNGGWIDEQELALSYARLIDSTAKYAGRRDFSGNLRHLVGSLLSRLVGASLKRRTSTIRLFNPSLGDFINRRIGNDPSAAVGPFQALRSSRSQESLRTFVKADPIPRSIAGRICKSIAENAHSCGYLDISPEYMSNVVWTWEKTGFEAKELPFFSSLANFVATTSPEECDIYNVNVVHRALQLKTIEQSTACEFLVACSELIPSEEGLRELVALAESLADYDCAPVTPRSAVKYAAVQYLRENSNGHFEMDDVMRYTTSGDVDGAAIAFDELVVNWSDEMGVTLEDDDISRIRDSYRLEDKVMRWARDSFHASGPAPKSDAAPIGATGLDLIDDLFSRT